MNKLTRILGSFLLITVLVFSLSACGQTAAPPVSTEEPTPTPTEEVKTVEVETPPPSPTPSATPTPSVPPVAVTTVPMPMPSVSPTVGVTTTSDPNDPNAATEGEAVATTAPTASTVPSPTPTPYSPDANFASSIQPDSVNVPANAIPGYITGNGVRFHAGPSESAREIAKLAIDTPISIIGREGAWTEIIVNGVSGYVRNEYVARGSASGSDGTVIIGGNADTIVSGGGSVIVPDTTSPDEPDQGYDPCGGTPSG